MAHGHVSVISKPERFDPTLISPLLWLDASDTSTITESSGNVSQWNDKSGNNRHLSQSTGTAQPKTATATINGLNVISFDGSDFLTYDAGSDAIDLSPLTFAAVVYDNNSEQNSGSYRRVISGRKSTEGSADWQSPNFNIGKLNTVRFISANGNGNASPYRQYVNQAAFIITGRLTSTSASIAVNDAALGSSSVNSEIANQRYLRVGASCGFVNLPPRTEPNEFWIGYICEIVFVAQNLSESNLNALRNYLNAKWAVY